MSHTTEIKNKIKQKTRNQKYGRRLVKKGLSKRGLGIKREELWWKLKIHYKKTGNSQKCLKVWNFKCYISVILTDYSNILQTTSNGANRHRSAKTQRSQKYHLSTKARVNLTCCTLKQNMLYSSLLPEHSPRHYSRHWNSCRHTRYPHR